MCDVCSRCQGLVTGFLIGLTTGSNACPERGRSSGIPESITAASGLLGRPGRAAGGFRTRRIDRVSAPETRRNAPKSSKNDRSRPL